MLKILLIEDDPEMIFVLSNILKEENYEVQSVTDGQQAMEKVENFKPDVIVTDVMIPKIDGWKLCKKFKENPLTSGIPILVLTGKSEEISELMSYECGADEYISKPFQNNDIINSLKRLIQKNASSLK